MLQRDDGMIESSRREQSEATKWPLYVRVLAVSHVLSYAVQWIAFFGLTGTAALLLGLGHPFDGLVLGLGLGGLTCVILCSVFRRWFVKWGRRNYPAAEPE